MIKSHLVWFLILPVLLLLAIGVKAQSTSCGRIYVDSAVATSGNGSSWSTALKTVAQALDSVNAGTCNSREIWVAKGTYYPMAGATVIATIRDSSLRILRNGIKLYGGFAGTETTLSARNVVANLTTLSGDIGISGDSTDNSYHVVTIVSNSTIDTNTRVDGFTIKRGNADTYVSSTSGGVIVDPYRGGGVYISSSSPVITNCNIIFNSSIFYDGGLYNENISSPLISNCVFLSNNSGTGGGLLNHYGSSPVIINCAFFSNSSTYDGGGMYNEVNASPVITNCTFSANTGVNGGGMYNHYTSSPSIANCILWGNPASNNWGNPGSNNVSIYNNNTSLIINYSVTETVHAGVGNSTANPLFVNVANAAGPDGIWRTSDDGLRLKSCSPAINTGSNAAIPANISTDITNTARILSTTVDKGAYEMPYNYTGVLSTTVAMSPANPVCSNTVITFTATTTVPSSAPTYQWYKNGVAVGTNQNTYTFGSWNSNDSVWVVHTTDCSVKDTSSRRFVQLVAAPAPLGAVSGNNSPCPGTQIYFVSAVTGATSYTWTVPAGWIITSGQGTASITATSTSTAGNVTVTALNSCSVTSLAQSLPVAPLTTPASPALITGPTVVCASSTGNVYSTTAITGATSYTWLVPAGWVITAGQGTPTIGVTAAAGTTSGTITVSIGNICQNSGDPVLNVSAGNSFIPTVTIASNAANPSCPGTPVTFTATPTIGGTAPSYQWKKNGLNVGTNSATYTSSALTNGDTITVLLTSNFSCASASSVTSPGIVMNVTPYVMPAISINGAAGFILCAGASNTFTTTNTAGGANPTYKWYINGVVIPGANASVYTGSNFANNDTISVTLTSTAACRLVDTVRSNKVGLTVYQSVSPVVMVSANPGTAVPSGTMVTFTAKVSNNRAAPSYKWYRNGLAIPGANDSFHVAGGLLNGDLFFVRLTALGLCATPDTLLSLPLLINIPSSIGTAQGAWKEHVVLFPNPNRGVFTVGLNGSIVAGASEQIQVEVINLLGQPIYQNQMVMSGRTGKLEIQLEGDIADGLYLLRLKYLRDGSTIIKPVMLQR